MNPARAKLLIVDESEPVRADLREQLNELGFVRIDEAHRCREALQLVRDNHYDLVICEWARSAFSGLDFLRAVRQAPVARSTPVLLISDDGSALRTVEALEAGANGLLTRPFTAARLADKVLRIVSALSPPAELAARRPERGDLWLPSR